MTCANPKCTTGKRHIHMLHADKLCDPCHIKLVAKKAREDKKAAIEKAARKAAKEARR